MTPQIKRREWLAASAFAALAACARNKGTGFDGYALVANAGDNSLAAVDLAEFRLAATIALNAAPSQVLAAPRATAAQQAYVLTPSNGTVHMIDSHLKRARSRRLADQVREIGISGDGTSLLALAPQSGHLIQADLSTLTPIAHHTLSLTPDSMDFSTTGYAGLAAASGVIELLHLSSGQRTQVQTPALGTIRFRADGKMLLAANLQNRSLLALDVPSLQTVAELPLAMRPDHLCFNSDAGQLFVSGAGMDGVAVVFPYKTMEVDQTLLAGRAPGTMACSADPAFLFVGSQSNSEVCVLNIDTRKVIGFVGIGGRPSFIRVTPDSQYVLVFDQAAGDMGVIRVPTSLTGPEKRLKTGASLFTMLSVGSLPVDAAIISRLA
jgi:DNA-binding beta-propeller fold protein YncE